MQERFEKRIEDGLVKIAGSCGKRRQKSGAVERRVGRPPEPNTRAGRAIVRRAGEGGCPELHATALEQGGEFAEVSAPDCGLLSVAQRCDRLDASCAC
jgi:hypothetical protein